MKEITNTSIAAWLAMLIEEHMQRTWLPSGHQEQPHIVINDETETATVEEIATTSRGLKLKIETSEGEIVTFRIAIEEDI